MMKRNRIVNSGLWVYDVEARDYGMEVISVASTSYSRAFFIEFLLGGQCPKRALQMVKRVSFIYIYISVSFYPYGCTLTTASRNKINVTLISQNFFYYKHMYSS